MLLPSFLSFGELNGYDFLSQLGFAVSSGSDSFMKPHDPKDRYSYDWGGENGIQRDITSPVKLQARVFRVDGWLLADNMTDFKAKLALIKAEVYKAGYLTVKCFRWDVEVQAILKSWAKFEAPFGFKWGEVNYVAAEISIEFDELTSNNLIPNNMIQVKRVPFTADFINDTVTIPWSNDLRLLFGNYPTAEAMFVVGNDQIATGVEPVLTYDDNNLVTQQLLSITFSPVTQNGVILLKP